MSKKNKNEIQNAYNRQVEKNVSFSGCIREMMRLYEQAMSLVEDARKLRKTMKYLNRTHPTDYFPEATLDDVDFAINFTRIGASHFALATETRLAFVEALEAEEGLRDA